MVQGLALLPGRGSHLLVSGYHTTPIVDCRAWPDADNCSSESSHRHAVETIACRSDLPSTRGIYHVLFRIQQTSVRCRPLWRLFLRNISLCIPDSTDCDCETGCGNSFLALYPTRDATLTSCRRSKLVCR